jgi:hypothetical protein
MLSSQVHRDVSKGRAIARMPGSLNDLGWLGAEMRGSRRRWNCSWNGLEPSPLLPERQAL